MSLQQRTVINQIEIKPNGNIQVREANEIFNEDGGIESQKFHRYVVGKDEDIPADVQSFIDNSKA